MLPAAPAEFDHAWKASQTVEQQQIPQKESVDLHSQAQHGNQYALMNVEHPEQLCGGSGIWPHGRQLSYCKVCGGCWKWYEVCGGHVLQEEVR